METILWAIDLILVAGFCFWAVREDDEGKRGAKPGIMQRDGQGNRPQGSRDNA